ncbi:MAG: UPF0175 family protein [bacterium]|nr:UPF0175 family protein [bacterium]
MPNKDTATKKYMQGKEVFADAFNFLLYGGKQVIKPEQLETLDVTSIALPYGDDGKAVSVQKYRDVLKKVTVMRDGRRATYLILGVENQSEIHYAMPVRNMLYDVLQYVNQVEEIAKAHKVNKDSKTGAEFLSGFHKTDRISPVITLTLYFGADEWTAPRDLHSMLAVDEDVLPFVDNYHLHLIAPAEIAYKDFSKFKTELSILLRYIKCSKDKQKLKEMVSESTDLGSVSKETVDLINLLTNSQLRYDDEEENVNMCKALDDWMSEVRAEGVAEGEAKGEAKGRAEGVFMTLVVLFKKGLLTLAQAAEEAGMTVAEFESKMIAIAASN